MADWKVIFRLFVLSAFFCGWSAWACRSDCQTKPIENEGAVSQAKAAKQETERMFPDTKKIKWNKYRAGVEIGRLKTHKPRPLQLVIARIDLRSKFKFVVTPSNGERKLETDGLCTSTFLKKHECDIAINAAPFAPVSFFERRGHDVTGLQIADGKIVSPADRKMPMVGFDKNNRVSFYASPPKNTSHLVNAITGFHLVLVDGKVRGQKKPLHPRTALGVTKDGKWLYLLVVDGRQKGESEGVTTHEVGQILKSLGCHQGINLDGGGTTTMVARDKKNRPQVLNRPVHLGVPGRERPSGSHLGIRMLKK